MTAEAGKPLADTVASAQRRPRGRRWWRGWLCVLGAGFLIWNCLAALHARAMLTFVDVGVRTPPPEQLGRLARIKVLLTGVRYPRPMPDRTPADVGLAYDAFCLESEPGVRLALWRVPATGTARGTVLLFHGYTGTRAQLLPALPVFHALGYDQILCDFRGRGESSGNRTTIGVSEARDVAALMRWARAAAPPGRPIIAYGVSMGAAALLRAIAHEGVQPDAVIIESVFDRLLTTVRNRFRSLGMPPWGNAELLLFWGGIQIGFNGFAHNPVNDARQATCPALFLHGAADPRARASEGHAVFEAMASPYKRWVVFEGAGHVSGLDADPDQWQREVSDFLRQQEGSP